MILEKESNCVDQVYKSSSSIQSSHHLSSLAYPRAKSGAHTVETPVGSTAFLNVHLHHRPLHTNYYCFYTHSTLHYPSSQPALLSLPFSMPLATQPIFVSIE